MRSRLLCLSAVMFFGVCRLVSSQEVPFRDDLSGVWSHCALLAGRFLALACARSVIRLRLQRAAVTDGRCCWTCRSRSGSTLRQCQRRTENVLPRDNSTAGRRCFSVFWMASASG